MLCNLSAVSCAGQKSEWAGGTSHPRRQQQQSWAGHQSKVCLALNNSQSNLCWGLQWKAPKSSLLGLPPSSPFPSLLQDENNFLLFV